MFSRASTSCCSATDQSLLAQIKLTRGDETTTRLEAAAERMAGVDGVGTVGTEIVFVVALRDPINRITEERGCDAAYSKSRGGRRG